MDTEDRKVEETERQVKAAVGATSSSCSMGCALLTVVVSVATLVLALAGGFAIRIFEWVRG